MKSLQAGTATGNCTLSSWIMLQPLFISGHSHCARVRLFTRLFKTADSGHRVDLDDASMRVLTGRGTTWWTGVVSQKQASNVAS